MMPRSVSPLLFALLFAFASPELHASTAESLSVRYGYTECAEMGPGKSCREIENVTGIAQLELRRVFLPRDPMATAHLQSFGNVRISEEIHGVTQVIDLAIGRVDEAGKLYYHVVATCGEEPRPASQENPVHTGFGIKVSSLAALEGFSAPCQGRTRISSHIRIEPNGRALD